MKKYDGNILIAKFMGFRVETMVWPKGSHRIALYAPDGTSLSNSGFSPDSDHEIQFNNAWKDLQYWRFYHKKWDDIMPVYKRICDVLNEIPRPTRNHCCKGDEIEVDIQCWLREVNIDKMWNHIVKFIEWYNQSETTLILRQK
jgi:hypothetical protein